LRIVAIAVLLFVATTAQAQDRGYYWDGYRWGWQGYGPPTRDYPPGPVYPEGQIPQRDRNCRGQACVDEFHGWGGYDRRQRFDRWGYPLR
jgi:hypothetical protein